MHCSDEGWKLVCGAQQDDTYADGESRPAGKVHATASKAKTVTQHHLSRAHLALAAPLLLLLACNGASRDRRTVMLRTPSSST
jgi:hypothetical protein